MIITKKAVYVAMLIVALAALTVPLVGIKVSASGSKAITSASAKPNASSVVSSSAAAAASRNTVVSTNSAGSSVQADTSQSNKISPEVINALGLKHKALPKGMSPKDVAAKLARKVAKGNPDAQILATLPPGTGPGGSSPISAPSRKSDGGTGVSTPQVGQPLVLDETSALSAALITHIGGRDTQFSEIALIADWDGREDCTADRGAKIDDFSTVEPDIDFTLTRAAISEHTFANGHNFNSYYYGDSLGILYFGFDLVGSPLVDTVFQCSLPELVNTGTSNGFTILNPTAGDCMDDQTTVTGLAVNPVADLGDFDPALCGVIGEVIYVMTVDTEGCAFNAANQPIRTRIFEFAVFEIGGTEFVVPGVRQILRSRFSNIAGIAVDDDGSLYYQLIDIIQNTGGALFKATEICRTVGNCGVVAPQGGGLGNPRINRVINLIPDPPTLNSWAGTAANPIVTANGVRNTNYGGGISGTFGNIAAITAGPCNVLYAAVARSLVATDDQFTRNTEGRFPAPAAFTSGTPSMIISFADCSGAFDVCSGETGGAVTTNVGGTLPVANGIADVATAATTTLTPGVNNFRIFAQGDGPNIAPAVGGTAIVPGTPSNLLKLSFAVDFTIHSGIAVSEEGAVYVISGGTPAGIGTSPSNLIGEILCFEDMCPMDRRADFVDLRGDQLPNPPASGGNVGDGDSDRFDHIFFVAPQDTVHFTPTGLSGLARGFLRYTNRLAPTEISPGVALGFTDPVQGDDDTSGPIIFENLDPGHQVAGGDDQNTPFRGDDDNGLGNPVLVGALSGGFEFLFGGPVGTAGCVWNAFFLNSNGNITFGEGDTSNSANVPDFRSGPPRIAPAWTDLNPSARDINLCTFPIQALGFANINAFKVRWINVPEFGSEDCVGDPANFAGATNTFAVTLYDDGTGIDENSSKALDPADPTGDNVDPAFDLQEGPTDLRFTREPNTNLLVPCPPRPAGSGIFLFEFCRMDLLGAPDNNHSVITGYSIGGLDELNPPGLCETNLSEAARDAETIFGVLPGGQTASIGCDCLIGEGTEPTIFELFSDGLRANVGSGGEVTLATPDFDLRFEGNDPALCQSVRQTDPNRGKVGFRGIGCAPPANATCQTVVPATFATTPGSTGLVNALCAVQLNIVGCGFFPNEVTTICQGFVGETGIPIKRDGKTVTTAATLSCDTNGDGIAETTVALVSVQPVSCNLVRATIPVSAVFGANSTSGFPAACCGGAGTITITTTFSDGDNNVFGPFTRTVTCSLALGARAPVVISVALSNGNCAIPQDLLITGACFIINGVPNVTSVFAIDRANCANRINATTFFIIDAGVIDAFFNFGSANAGKTFLIFVSGPNGTSRNISACQAAPAGTPAGCQTGNEQGIQVTFTCDSNNPGGGGGPVCPDPTDPRCNVDQAVVNGCDLRREASGTFLLDILGRNLKSGSTITINGVAPKKAKFKDPDSQNTGAFTRVTVKKFCKNIPGNIIIRNPGANTTPSTAFFCNESCPAN